jgi:hypothetical protein
MFKEAVFRRWKTTIGGVALLAIAVARGVLALVEGEPIDWDAIATAAGGLGLITYGDR